MYIRFIFVFLSLSLFSEELTGYSIMKKVREQSKKNKNKYFSSLMVINNAEGGARERFFNLWNQNDGDISKSLIRFFKPANVKKTALLTKKENGEKAQWIYLPALKSVKRLSDSDKNKSFMGSDFTNSDIAGRDLDEDTHTLYRDRNNQYVVLSKPKSNLSLYSKIYVVVDKTKFIVEKIIFYDKQGALLKILDNEKFVKEKDEYICVKSIMTNRQTGGSTVLTMNEVKVGIDIDSSIFSIRSLKQ